MMNPQYTKECVCSLSLVFLELIGLLHSREECTYQSFQRLLRWASCVRGLISSQGDGHQLSVAYQKVSHVCANSLSF
jgi:hypothetical protein